MKEKLNTYIQSDWLPRIQTSGRSGLIKDESESDGNSGSGTQS